MKNSYNNVVGTTLLFLGILFFSDSSYSQDTWKARIMLHNPATNQVDMTIGYSLFIANEDFHFTSPECVTL